MDKKENLKLKLLELIETEILLRKLSPISGDELLGEQGIGIDSLGFLNLLSAIEKHLDVTIEDDYWDYQKFKTLNAIIEYISVRM